MSVSTGSLTLDVGAKPALADALSARHAFGHTGADAGLFCAGCPHHNCSIDRPETVTIKRAAQLLRMSANTVREHLHRGAFGGAKEGGTWVVSVKSTRTRLNKREAAAEARWRELRQSLDLLADRDRRNHQPREQRRNEGLG